MIVAMCVYCVQCEVQYTEQSRARKREDLENCWRGIMFRSTLPFIARGARSHQQPTRRLFSTAPPGVCSKPASRSITSAAGSEASANEASAIKSLATELKVPLSRYEIELLQETILKKHGGRFKAYTEMITSKRYQREVREDESATR